MGDLEDTGINRLGELFNEYEKEFSRYTEPTRQLIDVTVPVRVRLYGDQQQKDAAWKREHPEASGSIYFVCVSSNPIEIWGVCRKDPGTGKLCVNHLSLGHELNHAMRVALSNWTLKSEDPAVDGSLMLSPDKYLNL